METGSLTERGAGEEEEGGGGVGWANVFQWLPDGELIEDWEFKGAEKELNKNTVKATLQF